MNATGGAALSEHSEGRAGMPSLLCGSEHTRPNAHMNERAEDSEARDGMPRWLATSGRTERGKGLPKAGWA